MATANRLDRYRGLALNVLRREMGSYVIAVDVREDDDHAGEQALYFVADLEADAPFDTQGLTRGQVALERALQDDEAEFRFPYLQTRRPPGSVKPEDFLRFRDELVRRRVSGRQS